MRALPCLALTLLPACFQASDRPDGEQSGPPVFGDVAAWVYYDAWYAADVWAFDAVVDDPDGAFDVIEVWADFYDEGADGAYVQSFPLYPTRDPLYWTSEWYADTTLIDPYYPSYTVDFVAYDSAGAESIVTVVPATW